MAGIAKLAIGGVAACLLLAGAFLGFARWAIAPWHGPAIHAVRTAQALLKVPAAEHVIIGDSRVVRLGSGDGTLFIGYSGASIPELERLTAIVCHLSDARITFALGINDAIDRTDNLEGSVAALERMVTGCMPAPIRIAQIWGPEPEKGPLGALPDLDQVAKLDAAMEQMAAQPGVRLIAAPELRDHTSDGVHFTDEYAALYRRTLIGAD